MAINTFVKDCEVSYILYKNNPAVLVCLF
jgi:hypothetical protein